MTYSARKLITKAYYLSGKVIRDFQTVGGSDIIDGLELLNALLSFKTANQRLIPYFKEHLFEAEIGEKEYFIEGLISIETFTFALNDAVRFGTSNLSRRQFFGRSIPLNVRSLPGEWHAERTKGGTNLFLYFTPDQEYPLAIWGKFGLEDVTLDEDLSEVYDQYYIDYLRYGLAQYIAAENGIMLQPQIQAQLKSYEDMITDISPIDLTMSKVSTLGGRTPLSWPYINLANGWVP